jgi:hypothetical protein
LDRTDGRVEEVDDLPATVFEDDEFSCGLNNYVHEVLYRVFYTESTSGGFY